VKIFRYDFIFAALIILGVGLNISGCGETNPLEELKSSLNRYPEYSIILKDMKKDGSIFPKYFHDYKLVYAQPDAKNPDSLVYLSSRTYWREVPEDFYKQNENYLGMTLASKSRDGKVSEDKYPPGYQYVGNPQYGQWRQHASGTSFWEFYGKYAMMRDAFGMIGNLISRNDYNDYRDNRRRGQPFFGRSSSYDGTSLRNVPEYGTYGSQTKKTSPSFFERKKAQQQSQRSSFLNKFKSRVSRGTSSTYRSRSFSSSGGGGGK